MTKTSLVVEHAQRHSGEEIVSLQLAGQRDTSLGTGVACADRSNENLTRFFMPAILRLMEIETVSSETRATLFHDMVTQGVVWQSRHPDPLLVPGSLVSIRWRAGMETTDDGHLWISRLVSMGRPDATTDLFETVPYQWVRNRELLERASALWSQLPKAYRHLFNAIVWEGARFQRFLMGPSSIDNHHNDIHGNLRHAVEVAELACALAKSNKLASVSMATFAGLIHDLAKADEYKFDRARGAFEMSDEGVLIGHRDRLQHWISSAVAKHGINLPEQHLVGLLHALTAAKGAPAYLGLREPRSIEATILTTADRMSGEADLFSRLTHGKTGFGEYHHHLRGRPFVTGQAGEF